MSMRGMNHWLTVAFYPSSYAHVWLCYHLYRLFLFNKTCYLCTDRIELVHSTFQCARDDLLWGTVK